MIFENKGKENTLETLHIALNAAKERGTTLVVASSAGDTLLPLGARDPRAHDAAQR